MKIIHISIRQAMELVDLIHDNNLDSAYVKDLIQEIENATGARYNDIERKWSEPR